MRASPRRLLAHALVLTACTGVIVWHNHVTGTPEPSEADREAHERLRMACYATDLRLVDEVIISPRGYYSYAEKRAFEWDA